MILNVRNHDSNLLLYSATSSYFHLPTFLTSPLGNPQRSRFPNAPASPTPSLHANFYLLSPPSAHTLSPPFSISISLLPPLPLPFYLSPSSPLSPLPPLPLS